MCAELTCEELIILDYWEEQLLSQKKKDVGMGLVV